jgi:hypothetical protein
MISEVVEEKETANDSIRNEDFTSESDESDVNTAKVKDDAIISKDFSQISTETREYSDNSPLKNEKTMKENEETAGHTPSDGRIQATQATHLIRLHVITVKTRVISGSCNNISVVIS